MAYKLVISSNANQNITNIIDYIINQLFDYQAAKSILDDIDIAYAKLEDAAEMYPLCADPYLNSKGYRKLPLDSHEYVILYQVINKEVRIGGIFHTRENYMRKL